VNGELRQDASTSDMIFPVATIIETLSQVMTLEPGDIIATGTPSGVGQGFDPPRFLRAGDKVEVSIGRMGRLELSLAITSLVPQAKTG
jgi:2-keto-4-pentenoate hydratase/2-oxohepta-3-ene-1,7-dioic acid hydratase in catechol pathway